MTYIYDIMLNFTDINLFYESYEWKNTDHIINVKKAPLFKVATKEIEDFINYKIKINNNFLNKINNQFLLFKKDKNNVSYLAVLSDKNKSIGISIDNDGYVIYKSSLLLDEEEEANKIATKLEETKIDYIKCSKINNNLMLRDDIARKEYLIKEVKKLYKNKKYDKLKYFYYEIFNKVIDDKKIIYSSLIEFINYNSFENYNIYKIIKEQNKYIEN